MERSETEWELVQKDKDRQTLRLRVTGGWLYYVVELGNMGSQMAHSLVFVPTRLPSRT
jgi:hypothetical protein